jgi:bacteriorhodopsin
MKIRSLLPKLSLVAFATLLIPARAQASSGVVLQPNDFVGISFWLISMALVASTAFFFLETQRVSGKWKTSLNVSGLVTLVAAVHYFYMREVWITTHDTPTVYRYIDWLITVPLLMVEFFLILSARQVMWPFFPHSLLVCSVGPLSFLRFSSARPAVSTPTSHLLQSRRRSTSCV